MRRVFGLSAVALALASSPLDAATISFERDKSDKGTLTYSSNNSAVTGLNWGINSLFVSDGIQPDPVRYNVDGAVHSTFDPNGAGTLEFFIDGCVPHLVGSFVSHYECTPTVASYVLVEGSVPDLGLSSQWLLVGDFMGGAADTFSPPAQAARTVSGGGTGFLSLGLSAALGFDPAAPWPLLLGVIGGQVIVPNLPDDRVTLSDGQSSPSPVPEPTSLVLVGSGAMAVVSRLRKRAVAR